MSVTIKGAWIAFESDVSQEAADRLVDAVRMLNGVAGVELKVEKPDHWQAREQVRSDLAWSLQAVVHGLLSPSVYVPDRERAKVAANLQRVARKVLERK